MAVLSENAFWEEIGMRAVGLISYGGAEIGECLAAIEEVGDGGVDRWHDAWSMLAARLDSEGRMAANHDDATGARDTLFRASTYYRIAYMPLFGKPVDERLRISFDAETAAFAAAAELSPVRPGTRVLRPLEVPFESGSLPGYIATPDDSGRPRPTILQVNGYDSNIHEMYFSHGPAANERGYNWIGVDGPGQGRNLIRDGIPLRPDWENVLGPILDVVEELEAVDTERIILVGWSLGGFLAPRAAAFHSPRLAALIADPGLYDQRDNVIRRLPLSDNDKLAFPDVDPASLDQMEAWLRSDQADPLLNWRVIRRGLWINDADSVFEYFRKLVGFKLSDVVGEITCPTMATMSENDPLSASAPRLIEAISAPGELIEFKAAEGTGGHCQGLNRRLYHQRAFDWIARNVASDIP